MDIKPHSNAVIVVRSAWANLPMVKDLFGEPQLTHEHITHEHTALMATVADSTDLQGLIIELRDQEDLPKQGKLLIPWSQILAWISSKAFLP